MPRAFSNLHGRRPDPKLFPVRRDELEEQTNDRLDWLGIDLQTWLNHLLVEHDNVERESWIPGEASDADNATAPPQQPLLSPAPTLFLKKSAPPPPEDDLPPPMSSSPEASQELLPTIAAPRSLPALPPEEVTRMVHPSMYPSQLSPLLYPAVLHSPNLEIPTSATLAACQLFASRGSCSPGAGAAQAVSIGITGTTKPTEPTTNLVTMPVSPGMPMKRSASFMDNGHTSTQSESPGSPTPIESTPFTWSECHNLISTDAVGVLVRQPSAWPITNVQVQLQLQLPLLFWAERRRWMWHKKWTLPKLHVHVSCDGKPVGGGWAASGPAPGEEPPVYAIISAGTLHDGSDGIGLYDKGLGGECQRRLTLALAQNTRPTPNSAPTPTPIPIPVPYHYP